MTVRECTTDPARRALMQRVRQRGTPAEVSVAKACRELGLRYRLNVRSLPGSPDIANKARRWAIFVNGCYWHHHTNCKRATIPTLNNQFWCDKFSANRARDARKVRELRAEGYKVIVVWECEAGDRTQLQARLRRLLP